jgi:hypothetical protein
MNVPTPEQQRLRTDLAQLRSALQEVGAPPFDELAVREAYRAARHPPTRAAALRHRPRWLAAAAAVLAVAGALGFVLLDGDDGSTPRSSGVAGGVPPVVTAFQPLQNSLGLLPSSSYSVVRVRIPLASLALVPLSGQGGTIEAELLVGEDGLARGIRFMQADALLVSAQP